MNNHETDDLWRLYHREWVIVHTISRSGDPDGRPVYDLIAAWMTDNLAGRVREEDMQVTLNTDNAGNFWAHAQVFRDTLKGEFKQVRDAQVHAQLQKYDEYTIVPRNSKSDHDIRNYGVVML
jgi:hypothetical protein